MTTAQTWLAQEVSDLLDVGSVGLYELFDLLRSGEYQSISDDDARAISREVAAAFVGQGRASIYLLRWPKDDVIDGPLSVDVLSEAGAWEQLPSKLYFALIPTPAE
ncbi:hypothetical protein Drose_37100 [Dactylosporangium roseum]|uniref:Uncharacterized protein n=1 Tax=Dactylosporangium roseum TaxID=47989 RepID=A0ABY5Z6V9_9ACTN|nr:hypothetical protein [Dactylosporangium roseum]UWZ36567.1 hypothetical protein Drose_37100 [Dactylosporangium roseum]